MNDQLVELVNMLDSQNEETRKYAQDFFKKNRTKVLSELTTLFYASTSKRRRRPTQRIRNFVAKTILNTITIFTLTFAYLSCVKQLQRYTVRPARYLMFCLITASKRFVPDYRPTNFLKNIIRAMVLFDHNTIVGPVAEGLWYGDSGLRDAGIHALNGQFHSSRNNSKYNLSTTQRLCLYMNIDMKYVENNIEFLENIMVLGVSTKDHNASLFMEYFINQPAYSEDQKHAIKLANMYLPVLNSSLATKRRHVAPDPDQH